MLPRFWEGDFTASIAWTLFSSDLLELMLKHFTQTLQMCGMDSVFLLFHSFCVQVTVADTNLSVLISTLEEYVCRDDPIPGQSQCIMCLCFKVGLTKFYALLQVIGCSNLSLADFMRWMRNCQGFM